LKIAQFNGGGGNPSNISKAKFYSKYFGLLNGDTCSQLDEHFFSVQKDGLSGKKEEVFTGWFGACKHSVASACGHVVSNHSAYPVAW